MHKRGESTIRERSGLRKGRVCRRAGGRAVWDRPRHGCEGNTVTLGKLEWFNWGFFKFIFCSFICFGYTIQHARSLFSDQGLNLCPLQWEHGVLTYRPPRKSLEWSNWYSVPDYQISAIFERGAFPWPGGLINTQPLSICWAWTWAWQMERRHFVHLSLVKLARCGINCPPSPSQRHKSREEWFFCSRRVWIYYYILLINVIPYSLNTDMNNEKNCILLLPYV